MADSTPKVALATRLRALAVRLDGETPAPLARRIAAALTEWEAELGDFAASGPAPKARGGGSATEAPSAAGAPAAADPGTIRIWSDGSCAPNPGPGGWAAIIERDGGREEISGAAPASTNNIMEMTGAIEGLARTAPGARIHLLTDSRYLVDGITRWLPGWKRRGWRKADGQPVLNQEFWQKLDTLTARRSVRWEWVRGHAGHPENEACDRLANAARKGL